MDLVNEIIACYIDKLIREELHSLKINYKEIVELECCKALSRIKEIISDDSFDDPECFEKIEEIMYALDEAGVNYRVRHDFG